MSSALIQGAIVAVIVLWAAWMAFGKLMPRSRTRALRALADQLDQPSRPQWSLSLAMRLRPPPDKASGCGAGCSSCDSCGSSTPASKVVEQPLNFVARK